MRLPGAKLTQTRPEHHGHYLYFSTTLPPDTIETGKAWVEWGVCQSTISTFPVKIIDVPVTSQPQQFSTGVAMWSYQIDNWPNFMEQYAAMGFNHMNLWHGLIHNPSTPDEWVRQWVERAITNNTVVSIKTSDTWDLAVVDADPDAQTLSPGGERQGWTSPCPSYRGPGFVDEVQKLVKVSKSGLSYILSDEERYGSQGGTACVGDRCTARWQAWLPVHRPDLEYHTPLDVITNRVDLPEHYQAWLWFRAFLSTERFAYFKQEFDHAVTNNVELAGVPPMLSWWAGAAEQ